ncbi:CLUMA_CG020498, isoform A [Clunio marinus]|uniref:Elongator complex protein 1 n=1 Tax=Clunio marinus TaxID=568069 RepID=A0A1J1J548_9DIPT|nr:CLUMA_CG020498, isoform A [Clunio marinus]
MKNLTLKYHYSKRYKEHECKLMTQHAFNENISFVYDGNNKSVNLYDHHSCEVKELFNYDGIIAMEYVQLNDCLCLATDEGEIVQYNFTTNDYEVVGMIQDGIETMSWSPDQELVVFVTKSCNVILMFSTFDVLVESSLHEKAAKEFITVGWGKKETQFHGSVGKDARKKQEINIEMNEDLDKTISCCWRGDGEYFAVNYVGENGRMFKVYTKEGVPTYTSEVCAKLQVPIAWKPSGLWIAKPEIHPNKYSITLFERNGLKHNELILPFTHEDEHVVNLSWSQDSDIFLIETLRNDNIRVLYFYTICNYHWYLKHTIEFNCQVAYNWSQNFIEPKKLFIMTNKGEFQVLKFDFIVNHSKGRSESDESIVAVIDGHKLLLTNFRSQMVPPPMASLEIVIDSPVNVVDFLQYPDENYDSNSFFTMDLKNKVKIYRCVFDNVINGKRLNSIEEVKEFKIEIKECGTLTTGLWLNESFMLFTKEFKMYLFSLDSHSIVEEVVMEKVINNMIGLDDRTFILQLCDGSLIELSLTNEHQLTINDEHMEKLPEFCESIEATRINDKVAVFGLKNNKKKLYWNSKELATEVTSFKISIDDDYLMYTTIGELKFLKIKHDEMELVDSRKVERGSKIIQQVKNKSQIIFQLPRGNLETISPRILSLKIIKCHLKQKEYKQAFDLLRKERINLNLLIDLNPQQFLDDLVLFVKAIDNIQWLNLFLTELKDEDVTATMYKFCEISNIDKEFDVNNFTMTNKVSYLCDKMLEIFQQIDAKKYLLPSITCYVKNQQIENALQLIWEMKKSGKADEDADNAVKYLLYLIDINVLYNLALGMYDYQLVLFVAQKSQKDPKEYVPFLNELNKLPTSYAKYKIDCHLKRFPKAIKHIANLCNGDDDEKFIECLELIKKHQLYSSAIEAFNDKPDCYKKICILYADHLRIKGKILESSLLYERGGDNQQALAGARNVLDWQRCIVLAIKSGYSATELNELSLKLSNALSDSGRHKEASDLVRRYMPNDVVALVKLLIKGRFYSDAIIEITSSGDNKMFEDIVIPQLSSHLSEAVKMVNDDKQLYIEQKNRLLNVRAEKIRRLQDPIGDDDEMFSDTTSMMSSSINSQSSKRTFKSSKNKRKHERKLTNLKEGNKFEDVALVDSLWKLVHKIISLENQNVIKDLIKNAVVLSLDNEASLLQKSFKELLLLLKTTMNEIWIPEMLSAGKYPETEDDMLQYNLDNSMTNKMCYELIKPEQRFKPRLNVIEFELELCKKN